mmetsp:Transcript_77230/g.174701  ORF Transcript_77230/g.174701 Transcript_77230/m.174701 type:complete len:524 (-) Transcript_77230:7-1578(-)
MRPRRIAAAATGAPTNRARRGSFTAKFASARRHGEHWHGGASERGDVRPPSGMPRFRRVGEGHGEIVVLGLVAQAVGVNVLGRRLVPEILFQAIHALVQILEVRLLGSVMSNQVLVGPVDCHLVLLDFGGDGVVDVLACRSLPPEGRAGGGHVHWLLQRLDLVPGLVYRVPGVIDLGLGLPDLALQLPSHLLIIANAVLQEPPSLGGRLVRRLLAASDQHGVVVAESLGLLLPGYAGVTQTRRLLVPVHLVPGGLLQRDPRVGALQRTRVASARGGAGQDVLNHCLVAALCRAKACLVDAYRLHLVVNVVSHLRELVLQIGDRALGPLDCLGQLLLCLDERRLLRLERDLGVVTNLLSQGTLLALGHAPETELDLWLLRLVSRLELRKGVRGLLDGVLQGVRAVLQIRDEPVRVLHLLLEAALERSIPAKIFAHRLLVRSARGVVLPACPLVRVLSLRHVEAGVLVPFVRRVHAHPGKRMSAPQRAAAAKDSAGGPLAEGPALKRRRPSLVGRAGAGLNRDGS